MDQSLRNALQRTTQQVRTLLEGEYTDQLAGTYDIRRSEPIPDQAGPHLRDPAQLLVRCRLVEVVRHKIATGRERDQAIDDYTREAAFTTLNRFVALKLLEARGLVQECVSRGEQSGGYREFTGLAPELALLTDGSGYRLYLECLFDEIGTGVKVLFDRHDPASLLWPRRQALLDLLEALNANDLKDAWGQDETIGWVYQYFNSEEERRRMREVSQAPRDSHELAVRNQFFTPRYVVQFLSDNTLGRTWYEMRQGRTKLAEQCHYLVRRSDEVFLGHMTVPDADHTSAECVAQARILLKGEAASFPEFDGSGTSMRRMINMAHCVNGYVRHALEDGAGDWEATVKRRVAGEGYEGVSTQDLLDVLFLTCRSDRHGGDASVYRERWFIGMANEIRRRTLQARHADAAQEQLLKAPIYIPYRAKNDPRDLKILDPACGSGHFLLYCFDLLLTIYEESWADKQAPPSEASGKRLREEYVTLDALRRELPGLILRNNLWGVDIDPRCAQIAAFALWLRAQRAFNDLGLLRSDRPLIRRTNIVVAEPMPGEKDVLEDFLRGLREDRLEGLLRRVAKVPEGHRLRASEAMADSLCDLVRTVWDRMRLAGEAGTLLKIEEELADAVKRMREEWEGSLPFFRVTEYTLEGAGREHYYRFVPGHQDDFWQRAELLTLAALREFAAHAASGDAYRRKLFVDDAEQGLAFIDACRQRYDAVLMNPPFGEFINDKFRFLDINYPLSKRDLGIVFVDRARMLLVPEGMVGALFSRKPFFVDTQADWRRHILTCHSLMPVADLGHRVLDNALVEVAATVFIPRSGESLFISCLDAEDKLDALQGAIRGRATNRLFLRKDADFTSLPSCQFSYFSPVQLLSLFQKFSALEPRLALVRMGLSTSDNIRFLRLAWEIPQGSPAWVRLAKGGEYSQFFSDNELTIKWQDGHGEMAAYNYSVGNEAQSRRGSRHYFLPALTYTERTASRFSVRPLPAGSIFSNAGPGIIPSDSQNLFPLLGILTSSLFFALHEMCLGGGDSVSSGSAARHYTSGLLGKMPFPSEDALRRFPISIVESIVTTRIASSAVMETSSYYYGIHSRVCTAASVEAIANQFLEEEEERYLAILELSEQLDAATTQRVFHKVKQRAFCHLTCSR
jgi:hypothetical protein